MQKYKKRIIAAIIVFAALTAAFFIGGDIVPSNPRENSAGTQSIRSKDSGEADHKSDTVSEIGGSDTEAADADVSGAEDDGADNGTDSEPNKPNGSEKVGAMPNEDSEPPGQKQHNIEYSKENGMNIDDKTGRDEYKTEPVPEGKPVPTEPQDSEIGEKEMTCVLSVRCDTILNNMAEFNPDKKSIVPHDGVIFSEREVVFYEGESVFNVTLREMKKNKIHMEFVNTPIYNSAYIEGIGNIYEYDCGELSGWLYSVNGWFPNYGCSRYMLKQGDKIEWQYTCDLGSDVGGYSASGGGQKDE